MGTIRDMVRAEMERQRISQSELSRRSGVSRTKIAAWLGGGDKLMREDSIEKILAALGLRVRRGRRGGGVE